MTARRGLHSGCILRDRQRLTFELCKNLTRCVEAWPPIAYNVVTVKTILHRNAPVGRSFLQSHLKRRKSPIKKSKLTTLHLFVLCLYTSSDSKKSLSKTIFGSETRRRGFQIIKSETREF
jgi:hypothetical protein